MININDLKPEMIVYYAKTQPCVITKIDEKEKRITLKWFFFQDENLFSRHVSELCLEFNGE